MFTSTQDSPSESPKVAIGNPRRRGVRSSMRMPRNARRANGAFQKSSIPRTSRTSIGTTIDPVKRSAERGKSAGLISASADDAKRDSESAWD